MLKKLFLLFLLIPAISFFLGASPWEGAAVTAPEGELPASGRFIATNAFPRNTVVDITNIETNRSTRVIVADHLNSPGLLAFVSREAADLIGMRSGSIIRIRMNQPADPIAYLRFREGVAAGIAGIDPSNVITEESLLEAPAEAVVPIPAHNRPAVAAAPTPAPAPVTGGDPVFLEPEWAGPRSRRDIVDLPIVPVYIERVEEVAEIEEILAEPFEDFYETAHYFPEEELFEEPFVEYEEIAEYEEPSEYEEIAEYEPFLGYEEIAEYYHEEELLEEAIETAEAAPVEFYLVPAEERPPVGDIYGIDLSDIIPGIAATQPKNEIKIEPAPVVEYVPPVTFSVPRIFYLERGWFYVQLAAFDSPQAAENALTNIDRNFAPVVYKDGDQWYRILLGPLNQGESAAILQRFRNQGFRDAFVRRAR